MKKAFAIIAMLICLAGCKGIECQSAEALNSGWELIGPAYRDYLQADPNLTEEQRQRRLVHSEEFGGLITDIVEDCRGLVE